MQLLIRSNSVSNPLTLDLTSYIRVGEGEGMDPSNPSFREAVISHSLLKEGGVLALENLLAKELIYPLALKSVTNAGIATLVAQINQAVTAPGATVSWQDDGMSQPTVFDLISGQFDIEYSYRQQQKFWLKGKLRLFSQPLGHTAVPRQYATASGMGPLLLITPYGSTSGQQTVAASTQAGVAGYGGPAGFGTPSGGLFYWGSPSLAGDAPALLQMTFVGASSGFSPSIAAVSLLPDPSYVPQLQWGLNTTPVVQYGASTVRSYGPAGFGGYVYTHAVGSTVAGSAGGILGYFPTWIGGPVNTPTLQWEGNHRLFALARASQSWGQLYTMPAQPVTNPTSASIQPGSAWGLYDLGTIYLRPSQAPHTNQTIQLGFSIPSTVANGGAAAVDITALYMLPDSTTWFAGPSQSAASAGGNVFFIDDVAGRQYATAGDYAGAPPPAQLQFDSYLITQYTRGTVPRPDPKNGLPILAVLAVGQGGIYPFPQLSAQVSILERTKYVLP